MDLGDATAFLDQAANAGKGGRLEEAIEHYRAVWRNESVDTELRLDAAIGLGEIASRGSEGLWEEAERTLNESKELAGREGFKRKLATSLHLLALIYRRQGDIRKATDALNQSPVLALGDRPSKEMAQHFHYRALLKSDQGELISAERVFYRAYQFYRETDYEPGIAAVCDSLANILLRQGKTASALDFCERSLCLKRKLHDRSGEAVSLGTKGRIHRHQAEHKEARDAFEKDLAISRELNDRRGIGQMLNSLGEVAWLNNELETAEQHFRQSIMEYDGRENQAHAFLGLTHVYLAKNQLVEAEETIASLDGVLQADSTLKGLPAFRCCLLGLQGAVAWRKEEFDDGERMLRETISQLQCQNHPMEAIPFLYELRDLSQKKGDLANSIHAMSQAADILSEHGAKRRVQDVEEWLRNAGLPQLTRLALERHFPNFIAEQIADGVLALPPAKRQRATILFCDVRGYTALAEGLEPEGVVDLLNEWLTEATRAIRRHGGFVDKFIGDAVMALFGVSRDAENAGSQAVRAALDMSESLWAMNLRHQTLDKPELRIGIGIATGDVVVGFIGSHLRQTYTAIGDAVNIASRLESATKSHPGCEIFISEDVERAQRQDRVAESRFIGSLALKGKDLKVSAYELLGRRGGYRAPSQS